MRKLRTAIVGLGMIARTRHIPAFKRMMRTVELAAVCDKDIELARKTASQFGISNAYSDVDSMLAREDLDLIDVCVPPQIHAPISIAGIEKGCDVIMEKPMALKTSDCDAMISASRRNDVEICVIHNDLFHPPVLRTRQQLADGEIGDFIGMRMMLSTPRWDMIDLKNHWYHSLPGGVIGETGPHVAYLTLAFLREVDNVDIHATSRLRLPWARFDEFRLEFEGTTGTCSAVLSYTGNRWRATIDIFGTEGTLHTDLHQMTVVRRGLKRLETKSIATDSLMSWLQTGLGLVSNGAKVLTGRVELGTDRIIREFVHSIGTNSTPPVTAEDGKRTVQLMERIIDRFSHKYG